MEKVKVEVEVPKELNDVRLALVELVIDIKAGKDLATLGAENLANIYKAVEGVDKIPSEVKEDLAASAKCVGLMAGDLVSVLLKKADA